MKKKDQYTQLKLKMVSESERLQREIAQLKEENAQLRELEIQTRLTSEAKIQEFSL